uniref:ATP synthase complex subunit 8 n=1 Tax=Heterostomus curvipalpis TaxID=857307 RepID=A0A3G5FPU0_9DIPT|nr:ATP synthase F0 subunit 8 [Heterostomus curvipalpis]UDF83772.1 ATP synthase F0 subunit 8 [Heterostomus curvipalpis]
MPQMAPISWLSLFIIFSGTFMLFSMMNYYSFLPISPKKMSKKEISSISLNWKW